MSRAQLRELMALFVIGSALTVAVFFLALWLLPDKPFTTFLFPRFPWCMRPRYCAPARPRRTRRAGTCHDQGGALIMTKWNRTSRRDARIGRPKNESGRPKK